VIAEEEKNTERKRKEEIFFSFIEKQTDEEKQKLFSRCYIFAFILLV
jgi:hypothetical protein